MLFRSLLALTGLLFLAGSATAAPSYPNPPTVNYWRLPESGHDPRLRVVDGRPIDVIFSRGGTDWLWDHEARSVDPIFPYGVESKHGMSSERFSVSRVDSSEMAVYEYSSGEWWSIRGSDVMGSPAIYDGTIVWPPGWEEAIRMLDAESREVISIPVSGGYPSMVGIWGSYLAYSTNPTRGEWGPNKLYVRSLLTGSTRLAFEGSYVGAVHASQGRVAYVGVTDSTVGLYVARLAVPGSAVQVRTPEHCFGFGAVRVAGATGNLVVYEASCESSKRAVYVTVVDSGAVYFVASVGSSGDHQFDAQGTSVAYFGADNRLHLIVLDESRM